jgi:hypothetical protein
MPASACLFCGAAAMREPLVPPLITGTLEPELRFYLGYAELPIRTAPGCSFNFEKHRRIDHYRPITERTGAKVEV